MPRAVCLDFEYGQGRVSPDLPNITDIFVLGEPLSCSHLRGNPSDRSPIGADEANRSVFQLGHGKLAVMDLQIVQNQEHLKPDESLLVHGVLIEHKPDFALTVGRRDHIDPQGRKQGFQGQITTPPQIPVKNR